MSEPVPPVREEIIAILSRMGVKDVEDTMIARCIELNAITRKAIATLPPPPDKGLEPAHVFSPPLKTK